MYFTRESLDKRIGEWYFNAASTQVRRVLIVWFDEVGFAKADVDVFRWTASFMACNLS